MWFFSQVETLADFGIYGEKLFFSLLFRHFDVLFPRFGFKLRRKKRIYNIVTIAQASVISEASADFFPVRSQLAFFLEFDQKEGSVLDRT